MRQVWMDSNLALVSNAVTLGLPSLPADLGRRLTHRQAGRPAGALTMTVSIVAKRDRTLSRSCAAAGSWKEPSPGSAAPPNHMRL